MAEKEYKIKIDTSESTSSINDLKGNLTSMKDQLSVSNIAANGLGGTIKNLAGSFKTLTKTAWSFVATPIGAIITAIVLAATALYNIFKSFKPVTDRIEQAFSAISAVASTLKNVFIGLFTGSKSLSESFSGLGKKMNDAAKEAIALTKAEQDLDDAMKKNEITAKQNEAEINKLLVQSKNRTLSEKERTDMLNKAMDLEKLNFENNKKIADGEYDIALRRILNGKNLTEEQKKQIRERGIAAAFELQDLADISDEEIERLKNAELKKIEIQNQSTQLLEKAQIRLDQIADKAAADEEKRKADAEAKRQKYIEKQIKDQEDANKKELIDLKNKYIQQGKDKDDIDFILKQKEIDHLNDLIELRKKLGQETLDLEVQLVDKKIEQQERYKKYTEDLNKSIIDDEKKTDEDVQKILDDSMNESVDASIAANDKKVELAVNRIDKEVELEKEKWGKIISFAQESAQAIRSIDEQATQFSINLLANQLKNKEISQKEYDKKLADIQKKAADRQKAYAVAETIINTAAAIMNVWKSVGDPTLATILSVAVGILGAAQVATILSTNPGSTSSTSSSLPSFSEPTTTAPSTSFTFADQGPKTSNQPIVKTYVLTKDVETAQQLDRQTVENGTIN